MSDRKAFEQWAKDKGYSLDFLKHSTGGAYLDHRTQAAWEQWNADPYPDKDPWEAYEIACKRISELEGFCKAVIRYAGTAGDDYLSNKAREALEPPL